MPKFFIFRVNYEDPDAHQWLMDELFQRNKLRQGWGVKGLQLLEDGNPIPQETWASRYKEAFNDPDVEVLRRYSILRRMLEIEKGDYLVIPKTVDNATFTICQAANRYYFDKDSQETFWDDFRHVIPVLNPKNYSYSSSQQAIVIASKFRAYQSAISNIWNTKVIEAIEALYKQAPSDARKSIKQILEEVNYKALNRLANELLEFDPLRFEDIIAECLKSRGYDIISRRQYDGKGADVDIVASYPFPYFSDRFDDLNAVFLFQIKKKKGTDQHDQEGVQQLVEAAKSYENPIKILITTSDAISSQARQLANIHGIKILDGLKVIDFILKSEIKGVESQAELVNEVEKPSA
ncbi:MAG: restriction endonuclease [Nitrospirae bacterium]|nr:MAG: restriction endonuclease [Nitrospirota bacterium]